MSHFWQVLEKAQREIFIVTGLVVVDLQQYPKASNYGWKAASVSVRYRSRNRVIFAWPADVTFPQPFTRQIGKGVPKYSGGVQVCTYVIFRILILQFEQTLPRKPISTWHVRVLSSAWTSPSNILASCRHCIRCHQASASMRFKATSDQ